MVKLIISFGMIGFIRPASGTWGSLAAIPAAWGIFAIGSWPLLALACFLVTGLGWWATAQYIAGAPDHDPSEVVIDEVAGQWLALLPVAIGASHSGADFWALWPGVLTAFLAFRALDIWKPGPVGWADRKDGALGVMLDDVLAGFGAAVIVLIGAWIAHGS